MILDNKRPCYWFVYLLSYNFWHHFRAYSFYLEKKKVCCKTVCRVTPAVASYISCLSRLLLHHFLLRLMECLVLYSDVLYRPRSHGLYHPALCSRPLWCSHGDDIAWRHTSHASRPEVVRDWNVFVEMRNVTYEEPVCLSTYVPSGLKANQKYECSGVILVHVCPTCDSSITVQLCWRSRNPFISPEAVVKWNDLGLHSPCKTWSAEKTDWEPKYLTLGQTVCL